MLRRFTMERFRAAVAVSTLAACVAAVPPAFAQAPSIRGVGDLPGGIHMSTVNGVSADGSVVIGDSFTDRGREAFRWTASGGLVGLGTLPGDTESFGDDVSGDGSVIVGTSSGPYSGASRPNQSYRWTAATGMQPLGALPRGNPGSGAYATNADGGVIVGWGDVAGGTEAYRWTQAGGARWLGDLPGGTHNGFSRETTPDGGVVVGHGVSAGGTEAFRWTEAGGIQGLGDLAGGQFLSDAYDVSADGSVVVGWSISGQGAEAFRWTAEGGMVGLGYLPGGSFSSGAATVTRDGSVVYGASSTGVGNSRGFVWDAAHGMRDLEEVLATEYGLDLAGWHQMGIAAVSDDGLTLAGNGLNPAGQIEGFVIVLPEPAGAAAIAFAAGVLALRRRGRRP